MRIAWRLVTKLHERDAFSGEGARKYGGRWNHRGTAVVYLSDTLALAALELFVHLSPAYRGIAFATFMVGIPDDVAVESATATTLPRSWRAQPPPDECKELGTTWAASNRTALLEVPSVIVPRQSNYVVNIAHGDFGRLKVEQQEDFAFDPRMWK